MSEKRFVKVTHFAVNDTWDNHRPMECASSLDADVVCHYLNEQQSTISQLKEENEQLKESNKNGWELIKFIYNEIKEEGSMDFSRIQDLLVIDDE